MYTYIHTHIYIYIYRHIFTYIYTYTYTYIHTYIYIHIYAMCVCPLQSAVAVSVRPTADFCMGASACREGGGAIYRERQRQR